MNASAPIVSLTISPDTANASVQLNRFFSELNSKLNAVSSWGKSAGQALEAVGHGIEAYFGVEKIKSFVEKAKEAQETMALLKSAIAGSGEPVAEFTEELAAQREELKKTAAVDEDVTAAVQNMLLTLGVKRKDLSKFTQDVIDMSAFLGSDAVNAARLFSNALQGDSFEIRGITIKVNQALPPLERFKDSFRQFENIIRGKAAAKANTPAAELDRLKLAFDDLEKSLGNLVIDAGVIGAIRSIVDSLNGMSQGAKEAAVWIGLTGTGLVSLKASVPVLNSILSAFKGIAAVQGISQVVASIQLLQNVRTASDLKYLAAEAAPAAAAIAAVVAVIWTGVSAWEAWSAKRKEALAVESLEQQTVAFAKQLREEIEKAGKAGVLNAEQVKRFNEELNVGLGGVEAQILSYDQLRTKVKGLAQDLRAVYAAQPKPTAQAAAAPGIRAISQGEIDAQKTAARDEAKAKSETALAYLKDQYDQQLITDKDYYERRKQLVVASIEAERAEYSKSLAFVIAKMAALDTDPKLKFEDKKKALEDYGKQRIELESKLKILPETSTQNLIDVEKEYRGIQLTRLQESIQKSEQLFGVQERLLQQKQQDIQSNWRLTEGQKQEQQVDLLRQQVQLYDDEISRLNALAAAEAEHSKAKKEYQAEITAYTEKEVAAKAELARIEKQANPYSFTDQLTLRMVALKNQWGSMAASMAETISGTVTSAVDGLSNALAGVIVGTRTVAQAFTALAQQVVADFISMTLRAVLYRAVVLTLGGFMGFADGGSIAGYADGGMINVGTGPRADDVLIRASKGEYVINAAAAAHYGKSMLDAINQRMVDARDFAYAMPRGITRPNTSGRYADGGMVSSGVAGGVSVNPAPVHVHAAFNPQDILDVIASQRGQHVIINMLGNQRHKLGIKS